MVASAPSTVVVKPGRAKPAWFGHPWIFSEAIARVDGSPEPGDEVRVVDADGRLIGKGFFNPRSQIRVRMASLRDLPLDGAVGAVAPPVQHAYHALIRKARGFLPTGHRGTGMTLFELPFHGGALPFAALVTQPE